MHEIHQQIIFVFKEEICQMSVCIGNRTVEERRLPNRRGQPFMPPFELHLPPKDHGGHDQIRTWPLHVVKNVKS